MKGKGFTLIELMISLSMASIIMLVCSSVYEQNLSRMNFIDNKIEARANLRIAMDYLCDRIKEGTSIAIECDPITINGEKIYIKNNILRAGEDSQQIANGIDFMVIEPVGSKGLIRIILKSKEEEATSLVFNGK